MVNRALGDRQFSKKEALKLRKQLDLFIAEFVAALAAVVLMGGASPQ